MVNHNTTCQYAWPESPITTFYHNSSHLQFLSSFLSGLLSTTRSLYGYAVLRNVLNWTTPNFTSRLSMRTMNLQHMHISPLKATSISRWLFIQRQWYRFFCYMLSCPILKWLLFFRPKHSCSNVWMSNIQIVLTNHISYITSYACMFQFSTTQAMIFLPTELPCELSRDMFASSARQI